MSVIRGSIVMQPTILDDALYLRFRDLLHDRCGWITLSVSAPTRRTAYTSSEKHREARFSGRCWIARGFRPRACFL